MIAEFLPSGRPTIKFLAAQVWFVCIFYMINNLIAIFKIILY